MRAKKVSARCFFSKSVSCIVATTLLIRMLYRAQAICVAVLCATCGGCWRAAQAGSGCCTCIFNSMENCVYMFRYIYIYMWIYFLLMEPCLCGTCGIYMRGGWHHLRGDGTCTCEVHATTTCVVDDITCVVMLHVPVRYMEHLPAWWTTSPAWWCNMYLRGTWTIHLRGGLTSPAWWWNMYLRGTWTIHLRGGRHHLRRDGTCTCVVHGTSTCVVDDITCVLMQHVPAWYMDNSPSLVDDIICVVMEHVPAWYMEQSTCVVDDITCVVMEHVPAWYTQTIAYYIITCAVMKIFLIILHIYIFTCIYIYTYLCLYVNTIYRYIP